ncbi:AAA family ATPase [Serratia fonticola]|uniref:AAA family ATPase n=1 Tax=Serratia fonticola TaxID=47917 RepID=UPI0003FE01C6|nr:AAA family ATPase [Serratia fonticola]
MRITRVVAENYKGFKRLDIDLDRRFTILCGTNGIGKSSVLFAIATGLSKVCLQNSRISEDSQIKVYFVGRDEEKHVGGFGKGSFRKYSNVSSQLCAHAEYIEEDGSAFNLHLPDIKTLISPLFIGPYRNIHYRKIEGMKSESSKDASRMEYLNNSVISLSNGQMPDIKQWMINRYFIIEKDWAFVEKYNWDFILKAICNSVLMEGEFQFNKIERDLEPSFLLKGSEIYLEELSSGFKSIISIMFSIVEWIEKTNEGDAAKIDIAEGTVIIDELDSHLHPSWQTKIKKALEETFPKIQFIVTTHSPHVISSGKKGEVLVLTNSDNVLSAKPIDTSLAFWKTEDIFQDVMEVDTLYDINFNEIIEKIENLIELKSYNEAKSVIEMYESNAHPNDNTPRALMRRINVLIQKERD